MVLHTATEHLYEEGRYNDMCILLLIDPNTTTARYMIKIPGMIIDLFQFQAFGAFVALEMEMFFKGGYLADDMGFGKFRCTPATN